MTRQEEELARRDAAIAAAAIQESTNQQTTRDLAQENERLKVSLLMVFLLWSVMIVTKIATARECLTLSKQNLLGSRTNLKKTI